MDDKTIWLIIVGCVFAVLLVCYIVALLLSKRDEMVFTANGWDMGLLLANIHFSNEMSKSVPKKCHRSGILWNSLSKFGVST